MSDLVAIAQCPICGNDSHKKIMECVDHTVSKSTFIIVECNECSFRFTNPIPSENDIGTFYESEDYVSHSDTKKGVINRLYHIVRNRSLKKKYSLVRRLSNQRSLLDIGCGTGAFLDHVNQHDWRCVGLEPSKQARDYAYEHYRLDVGDLSRLEQMPAGEFNVITMWHVLEHVHRLNELVEKVSSIMQKDGSFVVAVPNCDSYDAKKYGADWAAYDVPRHLYHFRQDQMKKLMAKHGLVVTEILPMKYDSYYVSMLSEKNRGGGTLAGFWTGWISNLKANSKNNAWSSLIYVIKHK